MNRTSGLCVLVCSDGYYKDTGVRECLECDSTCTTCSGGSNTDCTSCPALHSLAEGQCVSDSLRRSCDTKEFVYFVTTSVQICVNVCPDGTYGIEATRTCGNCDSTCSTCN